MIKNITILFFGIIFGGTVMILLGRHFSDTLFSKQPELITAETADYLSKLGTSSGEDTTNDPHSPIFQQAPTTGASSSIAQSFNIIQNNFSEITKSNNSIIFKNLLALKEKALKVEWGGIFDIITEIKIEIEKNLSRVDVINGEIAKIEAMRMTGYSTYTQKSHALTAAITEYLGALNKILVGKIPSKDDATLINTTFTNLSRSYAEYNIAANDFLKNI